MQRQVAFVALALGVAAGVLLGLLGWLVLAAAANSPPSNAIALTLQDAPLASMQSSHIDAPPRSTWLAQASGPLLRLSLGVTRLWRAAAEQADLNARGAGAALHDPGASCADKKDKVSTFQCASN